MGPNRVSVSRLYLLYLLCRVEKAKWGSKCTEWLLGDNPRVIRWVIDDGWLDEVALALVDLICAHSELVAVLFTVLEELLHFLILHFVLDRADHDALLVALTNLDTLSEVHHSLEEGLIDVLMDVDALCGDADLSRVVERTHGDFGSGLFDVNVRQDNGSVVAAPKTSTSDPVPTEDTSLTIRGSHASMSSQRSPLSSCPSQ